jgi:ribonuclease E
MKEVGLMVDEMNPSQDSSTSDPAAATTPRPRRRAASRPAGPPAEVVIEPVAASTAEPAKKAARKAPAKKLAAAAPEIESGSDDAVESPVKPVKKAAKRPSRRTVAAVVESDESEASAAEPEAPVSARRQPKAVPAAFVAPLFQAPDVLPAGAVDADDDAPAPRSRRRAPAKGRAGDQGSGDEPTDEQSGDGNASEGPEESTGDETDDEGRRRRRRRGGRGRSRRRGEESESGDEESEEGADGAGDDAESGDDEGDEAAGRRRRRRRRRGNDDLEPSPDDPPNTVVKVREPRSKSRSAKGADDVGSLRGSTRLEAKKQRRREGREAGRRRAPILTEAEFLARRESVNREMVVRQSGDRTQIAVLEDGVLVEHYVTRGSSGSLVGNVYLGRVQNVLPSMEAAFVDIGRGRNAVLYAGEVNWDVAGMEGQPKRIEFALKSGDPVLVQVTKDPVGQKGARLTSQVSLPGRFLVYVPDSSMTGISRKLPDTERSRLKGILKRVMPENAGVIVRTASEGAPEDALEQDIARLQAQWDDISSKAKSASPPTLLYGEPDLATKVVRDIFNEDVASLVVFGDIAWQTVSDYVTSVAPDLATRLHRYVGTGDVFADHRVDEQLAKALDRKVYLPSGGSLVIDRTEAMTVVDVNTGKFTGQGGNLEQTVTRNNLEAAEEIVRQLRLRDIGGIIVVDFIDMVLESNRDLVLRRLVECLGRDRTKHQVAEVTSLGLVQMTRKRISSGLIESFSTSCEVCGGRGIKVSLHPVDTEHVESPRNRRPANAVDPADVAARALAASEAVVAEHEEIADVDLVEEVLVDDDVIDDADEDVVDDDDSEDAPDVDDRDDDDDDDDEDEDEDEDDEDDDGEDDEPDDLPASDSDEVSGVKPNAV